MTFRIAFLLTLAAVILSGCATGTSNSQSATPTVSGYISTSATKKF
jgi:uncharacterized protein YceK